jgi:polar amino acid transport system substrate-binding protein
MNDLDNRVLAVELGALAHVKALEHQRQVHSLIVQSHNSTADALTAVMSGTADVALVDHVSARLFLKELIGGDSALVINLDPTHSEPYAVAVRIEDRILLTELNEALDRLRTSGRLNDIIEKHLGP